MIAGFFRHACKLFVDIRPAFCRVFSVAARSATKPTMTTIVTISNSNRSKTFAVSGRCSDVSDRIVRIKRAFGFRLTHSTQAKP